MKNKKIYLGLGILIIVVLIIVSIKGIRNNRQNESITNSEFKIYLLEKSRVKGAETNLVFMDDIDGSTQEEMNVKKGDKYSFDIEGIDYTIEILKVTEEYMTISIEGLAPTKQDGTFSLLKDYDTITINKNTGVSLNAQATDLLDGEVFIFYNK